MICYIDHCTGQNKNYYLDTAITDKVNSAQIQADTITLKYLQAGHTFMSAEADGQIVRYCILRYIQVQENVIPFHRL